MGTTASPDATTAPDREVLTWEGFGDASRELTQQIVDSGWIPDLIVAIARGGLIPAGAIAYAMDVKAIGTMNVEFYSGIGETLEEPQLLPPLMDVSAMDGKRVLVVDDVADSGEEAGDHLHLFHGPPRDVFGQLLIDAEVNLDEPVNPDGMNAHRPAISRIRTPLDPTVSFEPGQDSGHRRHVRPRATRQLRRSPWPLLVQRVKHGEIAVLEPQCLTDDTVARRERTVQPPQGEDHLIDRIISRRGSIHSCTLLTTRDTESFPHTTPGTATTPGADLPAWRLHSTILRPTYIMSFISIGCGSARCAYRDSPQCLRRNP